MPELSVLMLMLFVIAAAIVAIEIKDLLSSVVAFGAIGMGIAVIFLLLKAPDLAITQLVVELLCLVILIRATLGQKPLEKRSPLFIPLLLSAGAFLIVFLVSAALALKELPAFGQPLMRVSQTYIDWSLSMVRTPNVVTAIILDFRAYDTLGEATVLFTAVIGVLAIMRKVGRKKVKGNSSRDRRQN